VKKKGKTGQLVSIKGKKRSAVEGEDRGERGLAYSPAMQKGKGKKNVHQTWRPIGKRVARIDKKKRRSPRSAEEEEGESPTFRQG